MASHFRTFALLGSALIATACNVRWVDDPSLLEDDDDISWTDDDDTSAQGGAGGSVVEGGSDAAGGGDVVAPVCEWQGTGQTAAACETLPTSPGYIGDNVCGDETESVDAYSYLSCMKGFEIFNGTQAEEFVDCLATIQPAQACEIDPIAVCTKELYDNACEMDDVDELCAEMGSYCADYGDDFDVAACKKNLNPMNIDALDTLVMCMNDAPYGTCGERYDSCLDELITL